MEFARKELAKLYPPKLEGSPDAEITLVGWGSTANLLRAMMRRMEEEGVKTNIFLIKVIAPFLGEETAAVLAKCKRLVMIESNYTSQMARLLRMETSIHIKDRILKYDGEPFVPSDVYKEIKKLLAKSPAREAVAR
jgi:2-oxoglutarate ferredoxin oxidoreductase subunit alpha